MRSERSELTTNKKDPIQILDRVFFFGLLFSLPPPSLCSLLITDFAEELLLRNVEIVPYVVSKRPVSSFCYSYSLRYDNIGISNWRTLSHNEPTALQR